MLMGLISAEIASGYIQGEPMNLLIRSLPFQFYSILSLLFVLFYIVTGKDWGPMKRQSCGCGTPASCMMTG